MLSLKKPQIHVIAYVILYAHQKLKAYKFQSW